MNFDQIYRAQRKKVDAPEGENNVFPVKFFLLSVTIVGPQILRKCIQTQFVMCSSSVAEKFKNLSRFWEIIVQ